MSHVTEKNQSNVDVEQYQLRTDNKNTQKKLLIGTFLLSFVLANYQLRDWQYNSIRSNWRTIHSILDDDDEILLRWSKKEEKKARKNVVLWWSNGHSHCFQPPSTFLYPWIPRRRHIRPLDGVAPHNWTKNDSRIKKELKKKKFVAFQHFLFSNHSSSPVPFDGVANTSVFTRLLNWFIENTYSF